ncbi:hypothetical protein HZ326_10459 [Fusarium oxysporum f. sp. albedinis]|nr:hypothetical protein HZ326_10459 [Fusarium oxysporum f. sp. albedinis]
MNQRKIKTLGSSCLSNGDLKRDVLNNNVSVVSVAVWMNSRRPMLVQYDDPRSRLSLKKSGIISCISKAFIALRSPNQGNLAQLILLSHQSRRAVPLPVPVGLREETLAQF